jgi:membrane associated rhomboid family serine protease
MWRRPRAVTAIIFVNLAVFLAWMSSYSSRESVLFMMKNFLVSASALAEGRIWTVISSAFSHNLLWHFLLNMFVLRGFGQAIELTLGTRRFLGFYFAAAIVSGLTHSFVSAYFLESPALPALGASGAIAGLVLLFSLLYPRQKIYLFAILPLPAIWGALAFIGLDIWGLVAQSRGHGLPIGHGAHLGGAFTGIFYYLKIRRHLVR